MILRILILACGVFMTLSSGQTLLPRGLSQFEFNTNFEEKCFQKNLNDPYKINGQENPLANSLENFIAFAERFEVANPMITLRQELYYFLRNFLFENIQLTTEGAEVVSPTSVDSSDVDKLFEPDAGFRQNFPQMNEPFSDDERCSLYYMISHSIVDKPIDMSARSYSNDSYDRNIRTELNMDDYFPQEIGVVAVGADGPISLSRVLMGLYVGIKPAQERRRDISSFERIISNNVQEDKFPTERIVDPLYTLTLAEVLMLAAWPPSDSTRVRGFLQNGNWAATPLGPNGQIEGFCPMVNKQERKLAAYSYSSIRGAADGLILGMVIYPIQINKQSSKLSQILRMYYSREGVPVDQGTEDVSVRRVSFCNREDTLDRVARTLESQMELYGVLVSKTFSAANYFNIAKDQYRQAKTAAFRTRDLAADNKYCSPIVQEKTEDLPRETFLDVYVLMDSSVSEGAFQTQQRITGYLASYMDLRYTGSRMSILMDQKITTASSAAKIELKPVVEDSYSSSYVACTVGQIAYERSSVERDQVISAIDQLLEERKTNESKLNGGNGKVVIYYNFETDDGPRRDNNRIQGRLDKALQDFFRRQQDASVYAVGLDTEVLKKYARNDPSLTFLSADGNEEEVAQKLYDKLSGVPGLLQYPDCADGRSENSAVYENFVSPLSLQHWQMPAKYFYKSLNLKVAFESQSGPITVCHSRATMKPENEVRNCLNTSATNNRIEFKMSNPCKSFTKETCAPFYFSVMGMTSNAEVRQREYCNDITDHWCSSLNGIKFKVTHQGIRCSGCLGLATPPIMVLLTVLLSYILNKSF